MSLFVLRIYFNINLRTIKIQIFMKQGANQKNSRSKRSLMIINLVETPGGYSIIEGTETFNKNAIAQAPSNPSMPYNNTQPIVKQQKMVVKQNHLLFLKAPTNFQKLIQTPTLKTPPSVKQFATWFSLQDIHPIQVNQVKIWTLEDYPEITKEQIQDSQLFNELVQKYRKQRNMIIEVYAQKYASTNKYMSASVLRKYICDDAYWLMRIHVFLSTEGIINHKHVNLGNQQFRPNQIFRKNQQEKTYDPIVLKKYQEQTLKEYPEKGYQNEKNLVLKKITSNIRPYCDFCGIHCGIVWFQHLRTMDPKQISSIMKNVNSKNPPLSQKQYEIILCTKCYCNGSFPLLLTHHDFRKVSINDKLEPDRKKKSSKNKRKQQKRKRKQKQMMQENEQQREEEEQKNGEPQANGKNEQNEGGDAKKEKEENEEEDVSGVQRRSGKKRNRNYTNQAMRLTQSYASPSNNAISNNHTNINDNGNNSQNHQISAIQSAQNASKINERIEEIISKINKPRQWSEEQVYKLLCLVEQNGDNWNKIHQDMVRSGYCYDSSPQDMVRKFVQLSQHVSTINQQPEQKQITTTNRNTHKSTFLTKLTQKNMDKAVEITYKIQPLSQQEKSQRKQKINRWKHMLDQLALKHIKKIQQKIELTNRLQAISVQMNRYTEQIFKEIQEE